MRPQIFEQLSREYEDERQRITAAIDLMKEENGDVVDNLDSALLVISEIADRYSEHTAQRQRDILRQMVKRVIIDPEGRIIRMELKPPFNYLDKLAKGGQKGKRGKGSSAGNKKTSKTARSTRRNTGSLLLKGSAPDRIRTYDTQLRRLVLYPAELLEHIQDYSRGWKSTQLSEIPNRI